MLNLFFYHLQLCLPLFLLVIVGWALIKAKLFEQSVVRALSGFTFRFLMPAMLFSLMSKLSEMPPMDWRVLIAFFGSCIVIYCLGRTAGRFFGLDNTGKTIFGMAAIFGNNVQLGVPILQVSLGNEAMPAAPGGSPDGSCRKLLTKPWVTSLLPPLPLRSLWSAWGLLSTVSLRPCPEDSPFPP